VVSKRSRRFSRAAAAGVCVLLCGAVAWMCRPQRPSGQDKTNKVHRGVSHEQIKTLLGCFDFASLLEVANGQVLLLEDGIDCFLFARMRISAEMVSLIQDRTWLSRAKDDSPVGLYSLPENLSVIWWDIEPAQSTDLFFRRQLPGGDIKAVIRRVRDEYYLYLTRSGKAKELSAEALTLLRGGDCAPLRNEFIVGGRASAFQVSYDGVSEPSTKPTLKGPSPAG